MEPIVKLGGTRIVISNIAGWFYHGDYLVVYTQSDNSFYIQNKSRDLGVTLENAVKAYYEKHSQSNRDSSLSSEVSGML